MCEMEDARQNCRIALPELPLLTSDLPGMGGVFKREPEDFVVEEIPAYEPSGKGPHLFLWIEKRGVAAGDLTQHVSRALRIAPRNVGCAGLKDRQAVTRQYLSVPAECADRVGEIDTGEIRVLRHELHGNKLRTGQLRGNRFSILVRDVVQDALNRARSVAIRIETQGFPNFFGDQRFGHQARSAQLGFDLLQGAAKPGDIPYKQRRFALRLALSAAQSVLFNAAAAERIRDGVLHQVLLGDVMQVVASGGPFVVADVAVEQPRFDARETVITGPVFGPKMKQPTGVVAQREQQVLQTYQLDREHFRIYRKLTPGTRRPYLVWPKNLQIEPADDGIRFHFTLPRGVYATTMLREFIKG